MKAPIAAIVGLLFFAIGFVTNGFGQTTDALINKLVEKGILTTKEAEDLRQETIGESAKATNNKTLLSEWTENLKFSGDVRMRYDNTSGPNPAYVDQQRFRLRLRFGALLTFKDDLEAGIRLISGPDGSPLSGNQTLENNGSKKAIWIDRAYGKWSPRLGDRATLILTAGKMENPFVFTEMVMDADYTPEGFAQQLIYRFNTNHSAKLILGEFVLDELTASSHDPFLFGSQLRFDSQWNRRLQTSFGVAGLMIYNASSLVTTNVPDINNGNTRTDGGSLVYNYNPIVGDAAVTYSLDSFPLYRGAFPINVFGQFIWNPAVSRENSGWTAGTIFGKADKKGTWEISYRWERLEGDAWYEELVSDEFGGFYQSDSSRGKAGARGGTNVQGHAVRASYAVTDCLTFGVSYLRIELIDNEPSDSKSRLDRIFLDTSLKF